ncbi:MAG: hypothetical protein ACLT8E_04435 [Akkermansia sp.]
MLDYLFQHFYSTLAIFSFCIAILILRALGKRSIFWIPVSTAPLGCITFLAVFLLLTAFIIGTFGFFTTGPMVEDLAFTLHGCAHGLRPGRHFTPDRILPAQDKSASKLYPGESRSCFPSSSGTRASCFRADRRHQLRY